MSLERYRKRLTRRQRAVLGQVEDPSGPSTTISANGVIGTAAGGLGLAALTPIAQEAQQRLVAHGMAFRHAIKLTLAAKANGTDAMNAFPQWLFAAGSKCQISILPSGAREALTVVRRLFVHELMHCAAAEQVSTGAEFEHQPEYVQEGLPEWASYRVAVEWQGTTGPGNWWSDYLDSPEISLLRRAYDAAGFWSLLEHEGVDVWRSQPGLVQAASSGDAAAALRAAEAVAPALESDWGSTLATQSTLGARWDLMGPDMPPRTEPQATIGNGADWGHIVSKAGAFESRIDITADVIRVRSLSSIHGWLRDGGGTDRELGTDQRYCTDGNGCECPDGTTLGYPEIQPGDSRIGFADSTRTGAVVIAGESLDEHCKEQSSITGLQIRGSGLSVLATFKSGTCKAANGKFTAKAIDGGWSIEVHINHFVGYSHAYSLQNADDPGFTIRGPGGPYSNAFAAPNKAPEGGQIRFYPKGTKMSLGFEYAWNAAGSGGVLPLGVMSCKRPKR